MKISPADEAFNIESIMQQIRAGILAQRAAAAGSQPLVSPAGERFAPDYYEQLYQAALDFDQILPPLLVTPVPIPLLGPWLERLRAGLHRLVLFYVGQVAARQVAFNAHWLAALDSLGRQLEEEEDNHER